MPTRFVGIHLALAIIVAFFGLSFVADPCGGGGDLCLGGALGVFALGVAAFGGIGIGIWLFVRRASPLLLWDAALVALAGTVLVSAAPYGQGMLLLGALGALLCGLAGGVLAGREVAGHRLERLFAIGALVASVVVLREAGLPILILGLLALALGWRRNREGISQVA